MTEVWISRDSDINDDNIDLWYEKPKIDAGIYNYDDFENTHIITLYAEHFEQVTGFKLNPGECKKVEIRVFEK